MLKLKEFLRRFLARWSYLLSRVEPAIPPGITGYLHALRARIDPSVSVVCFDHEIAIQYAILEAIPKERVIFVSPPLPASAKVALGTNVLSAPREPFAVFIDT